MTAFSDVADVLSGARRRDAKEFAALLEGGRARSGHELAPLVQFAHVRLAQLFIASEHPPTPDFRATLRAALVAEAAVRLAAHPGVPAPRSGDTVRPSGLRWRQAVAALAVATTVSGVGVAVASTSALPGDALYSLKLRIEAVQLSLADSDLERGREHLEQAEARLAEAEHLSASGTTGEPSTDRALARALTDMEGSTTAGAAALFQSYQDTGEHEPMLLLERFVADQWARLLDLLPRLDPDLADRVRSAVEALSVIEISTAAVLGPERASAAEETAGLAGSARADGWVSIDPAGRGALPPSAGPDQGTGTIVDDAGRTSTGADVGAAGRLATAVDEAAGAATAPAAADPTDNGPVTGTTGTATSVPTSTATSVPVPTSNSLPGPSVPAGPSAPAGPSVPTAQVPPLPGAPTGCIPVAPLTSC